EVRRRSNSRRQVAKTNRALAGRENLHRLPTAKPANDQDQPRGQGGERYPVVPCPVGSIAWFGPALPPKTPNYPHPLLLRRSPAQRPTRYRSPLNWGNLVPPAVLAYLGRRWRASTARSATARN